ncbi:helix-turn-helix transcriptional regulator [Pseudomonas chlororaphis]|uniref:helix-turn-helix domain-containing protein n=1 Tax=Pseudomonas chlororaphis TaxID=587753 RepID=UPI0030D1C10C
MPKKTLGERLKEERERLGYTQPDFAALVDASKRSQIGWEQGRSSPDASSLEKWIEVGLDALYVLTGNREKVRQVPNKSPSGGVESFKPIDVQRLNRIAEMLEAAAKQAGKRWPATQLVAKTAEVYNFLAQEKQLDDSHVDRVLKLVVSH